MEVKEANVNDDVTVESLVIVLNATKNALYS